MHRFVLVRLTRRTIFVFYQPFSLFPAWSAGRLVLSTFHQVASAGNQADSAAQFESATSCIFVNYFTIIKKFSLEKPSSKWSNHTLSANEVFLENANELMEIKNFEVDKNFEWQKNKFWSSHFLNFHIVIISNFRDAKSHFGTLEIYHGYCFLLKL